METNNNLFAFDPSFYLNGHDIDTAFEAHLAADNVPYYPNGLDFNPPVGTLTRAPGQGPGPGAEPGSVPGQDPGQATHFAAEDYLSYFTSSSTSQSIPSSSSSSVQPLVDTSHETGDVFHQINYNQPSSTPILNDMRPPDNCSPLTSRGMSEKIPTEATPTNGPQQQSPRTSTGRVEKKNPKKAKSKAKARGKKGKDRNRPQKPVSAYALFFREKQAEIKGNKPDASFGEISKTVASEWDSLTAETKANYKQKADSEKCAYLRALATYKANHLGTGSNCSSEEQSSIDEVSAEEESERDLVWSPIHEEGEEEDPQGSGDHNMNHSNNELNHLEHATDEALVFEMSNKICIRLGCTNVSRLNPEWDNEFCSNECCVRHCSEMFNDWVASRVGPDVSLT